MDGSSASWRQSCMTGTTYARTQHAVYCHTHIQAIQTTRWTVMCRMVSWDGPRSRDPEIPRSPDPRSRDDQIHKMDGRVYGSTDHTHSRDARARQGIDVCKGDSHSCLRTATRTRTQDPRPRDPEIARSGDAIPEITRSGDDETGVWIHRPREHRPHQWWV